MVLSSLLLNKPNSSESLLTISSHSFLSTHSLPKRKVCEGAEPSTCCCSHMSWGADQHTLLHLYGSLVRSKLDYGSVCCLLFYARILRILDPIQNHALRLCLGAFRTSPASSMCVQANEPPLYIQRRMLSIQYSLRLGSSPSNPAYNTVFSPKSEASFSSKPNQIPTLGIRIAPELEKIGFKRNTVFRLSVSATLPWLLRRHK